MKTKKTLKSTVIAALAVLLVFSITALSLTGCSDGGSPASHTHQWGAWQVTTAATCTTAGVETRVCALDSSHKETRAIAIDPQAHDYGTWTETTAPTETEQGEETRTCSHNAAHTDTRPVAVLHTHQWGVWTQTTAPTETEDGEETRTCALDPSHEQKRPIAALNHEHQWGEWQVTTPATCTTAGEKTRTCALNALHIDDPLPIAALGHNYGTWTQTTAPTCTTAGVDTRTCSHDAAHKETRAGAAALGHNFANYIQTTAPTCTEAGIETGTCTHDATHKETRAGAAAIGHDWKNVWTVTTASTTTAEGVETDTCAHNAAHTRTRPIPTLKTVTFNSNDGSAIPVQTLNHGGKATKPADPTKSGYNSKFVNWYKEAAFTNLWDFANDTVTANTTLYAKWEAYSIGDTGPGGGKIFYRIEAGFTHYQTADDTAGITAWYLEAAPDNMATTLTWASSGFTNTDITGTADAIGRGMKNTTVILATDANAPAAKACADLTTGGKTDWFLPSKDELNQLYVNRSSVGNLGSDYWSSSQSSYERAWGHYFSTSGVYYFMKYTNYYVRAIRAF